MGFKLDGYGFSMILEDIDVNEPYFPEGFELRSFKPGRDEEDWCEIRNIGFSDEGPMSPDRVHIYLDDSGHIDGGMMILYHKGNLLEQYEYQRSMKIMYHMHIFL